jgi:hypothetical protein
VPKPKNTRLSVFKGREARLNLAIFQTLALEGPLTVYDMHREVRRQKHLAGTKYTVVLRRVRRLEESNYREKIGARKIKTQPGSQATVYQLTARAYLAILLNSVSLEELLTRLDETAANEILETPEEITQLLEVGFEYICEKDGLIFFRKRK